MNGKLESTGRRNLRGQAQAALLGLVAVLAGLGLAFISGALDPGIAKIQSWFAPQESAVQEAPPVQPEPSDAPAKTAQSSQAAATDVRPSVAAVKKTTAYDRNEKAVAALSEDQFDLAIELLKAAVEEQPANVTYRANLGEAYLRRARSLGPGDFDQARADFEDALAYIDNSARIDQVRGLMERAENIAREEANFSIEETVHFTFKFDASRTEIRAGVDRLQVVLEDTYQEYGELFGRRPVEAGEAKIAVVLYRSAGFSKVTGLGDWAGGAFDGTIRVPADDLRDPLHVARLRDVLRHEVAHAFCQSIGGQRVPSWLNEGIAQWLENPALRYGGLQSARARLANARDNGGLALFSLDQIQGSLVGWESTTEITRAYDQAFAFVDYLVKQYGPRLLFDLVAECKEGGFGGAAIAFERQILVDIDVVLADFGAAL